MPGSDLCPRLQSLLFRLLDSLLFRLLDIVFVREFFGSALSKRLFQKFGRPLALGTDEAFCFNGCLAFSRHFPDEICADRTDGQLTR